MNIGAVAAQTTALSLPRQSPGATKSSSPAATSKPDGDGDHGVEPGKGQHINIRG